jgi:hypothetical protein
MLEAARSGPLHKRETMPTRKIPELPELTGLLLKGTRGYPLRVHGGVIGMQLQRFIPTSGPMSTESPKPASVDKNKDESKAAEATVLDKQKNDTAGRQ